MHKPSDSFLFVPIYTALRCRLSPAVYVYTKLKPHTTDWRRNLFQNQENNQNVKSFWNICTTKGGTSRLLAILAWWRTYWSIVYSKITRTWGSGSDWLRPGADGGVVLVSWLGCLTWDIKATLQCAIRAHIDRILAAIFKSVFTVEIEMWILLVI